MEKIGEGLQYEVFLVDEDKVRKVPRSREKVVEKLRGWHDSEQKVQRYADSAIKRREKALEELKSGKYPLERFFAIESFQGDEILQKRMKTVEDVMQEKDFDKVVDDYLDLLENLWRHGIGDTIYNFTVNNGYRNGKIFQLDFGELVFDKSRVREEIRNRKWMEQWSYTEQLDKAQKETFREKTENRLTLEKVDRLWNSRIK